MQHIVSLSAEEKVVKRHLRYCHSETLNVAHFSKYIKGINTKLGILAHHDKMQAASQGYITLKAIVFEFCPFLTKRCM